MMRFPRSQLATAHGAERMSLNAAHRSESGKPFARAAGAVFALFDRVPGLRSVIALLRRNPKINPAERHRIERKAVQRRHQRERFVLERRHKALGRLENRDLRSLENSIRRRVRELEIAREQRVETLQDRAKSTSWTLLYPPVSSIPLLRRGRRGWKARQEELGLSGSHKQSRPKRYRRTRDDP